MPGVTRIKVAGAWVDVGAGEGFQVGDMKRSTDSTQPGWALCDGSALPRTGSTKPLFDKIGTRYGQGDGLSTFNVPKITAAPTDLDTTSPTGILTVNTGWSISSFSASRRSGMATIFAEILRTAATVSIAQMEFADINIGAVQGSWIPSSLTPLSSAPYQLRNFVIRTSGNLDVTSGFRQFTTSPTFDINQNDTLAIGGTYSLDPAAQGTDLVYTLIKTGA